MKIIVACCMLALSLSMRAGAQESTPRVSEIAASGRGEVRFPPDRAILTVTVETNARTATEAAANNARAVASTLASLRAAGVKESELSNSSYSVNQDFENGDRRRPRGFVAHNSIRIEVPRVSEAGKLIDAALAGGATIVAPIQFLGPDMPNARRDALKAAVAEAKRDAEAMAEASGGSLGRLLSMSTGIAQPMGYDQVMVRATGMASPPPPTTIRPGDIVVAATANGRWEFVPRR
jgi:uncharacterized protein YggE